ncbi:MAG: winged helix-turn-helix transcriptional regulator [Candidatus Heimdallarchaeota archaeon]
MADSGKVIDCEGTPKNGLPCFVPAQKILHLISSKWGIQLIYILKEGKNIRYKEIREELQKGWKKNKISDATLSSRLGEFVDEGLIKKEIFPELPPRVEYSLTKKGEKLSKALEPLIDWTIKTCHEHH